MDRDLNLSTTRSCGPARVATQAGAVNPARDVQRVGGVADVAGGVEQASVDHVAGTVEALFAGLEHEQH